MWDRKSEPPDPAWRAVQDCSLGLTDAQWVLGSEARTGDPTGGWQGLGTEPKTMEAWEVLGPEPRAPCELSRCATTQPHPGLDA